MCPASRSSAEAATSSSRIFGEKRNAVNGLGTPTIAVDGCICAPWRFDAFHSWFVQKFEFRKMWLIAHRQSGRLMLRRHRSQGRGHLLRCRPWGTSRCLRTVAAELRFEMALSHRFLQRPRDVLTLRRLMSTCAPVLYSCVSTGAIGANFMRQALLT